MRDPLTKMVRALRAVGWRVRNGGRPKWRGPKAQWDFCRTKDSLLPMTAEANAAVDKALAGEPIPERRHLAV
jgi:hypothetical protein